MVWTIFMPRYLGAVGVGKIQFAVSLWMMLSVLITCGTDVLLSKEIARNPERTPELFGNAVVLRCLVFVLVYGALAATLYFFAYPLTTIYVTGIIGFACLGWQLSGACQAILQGLERMEIFSFGQIVGNAVHTAVGIMVLLMGAGIYVIATLTILSAVANLMIQLYFLGRMYKLRLHFNRAIAWQMLKAGVPYLFSNIFLVVYMQLDIVILSALIDEKAIGWYGTADRLFGTFLFIPSAYITAAFPALSRMFVSDLEPVKRLMSKSFDMLLLLAVPIGLGLLAIANPLVVLLFGTDFANSGPVLAVMGIVLILTYQNMLIGRFLISADRQNAWTIVMAIATFATIPLDILLIPWCERFFANGAIGGGLSFVITELAMVAVGLWLLPKGAIGRTNLWTAVRILIAGLGMVTVVWPFQHYFIAIPIGIGMVTYGLLVLLLRIIPQEDFALLGELAHALSQRLRRTPAAEISG